MYATEVSIHELTLNLEPPASNSDMIIRLEKLHRCLKAIENWFQVYEQIPAPVAIGVTFDIYIQLMYCIVALIRLTKFDGLPAWDTAEVRRRLDVLSLLDRIADGMEKLPKEAGVVEDNGNEDSVWSRVAKGIRLMKIGTQADLFDGEDNVCTIGTNPDEMESIVTATSAGGNINIEGQQDMLIGDAITNFVDDPWLSAMFIPWDSMRF